MTDTAFSRVGSVDPDKKLEIISFKCSPDFKDVLVSLAAHDDMDVSEFIRWAVQKEINSRKSMYEALHRVFGDTSDRR